MSPRPPNRRRSAFTLLELILSMTVLVAIVAVLVQVMSNVQRVWRGGADDAATARIAFLALDRIAADLAATAQGSFPFDPVAREEETAADEDAEPSKDPIRPPILVIAPAADRIAPLPPEQVADDPGEGDGSEIQFSRVAVLCEASRPVWTDDDSSSLRPLRRPPRSTDAPPLRGLLRVRYDVVPRQNTGTDAAGDAASTSGLCHDLVRTVAGLRANDEEDAFEDWWDGDKSPDGFGSSEVLARNVVWFGVTVPDFLGTATNDTHIAGAADGAFHVWGNYTTVATDPHVEPLPPLVDVVLGLVSDRTLSRAESQSDETRRAAILREGLRVYVRRIQLK